MCVVYCDKLLCKHNTLCCCTGYCPKPCQCNVDIAYLHYIIFIYLHILVLIKYKRIPFSSVSKTLYFVGLLVMRCASTLHYVALVLMTNPIFTLFRKIHYTAISGLTRCCMDLWGTI